MAANHKSAHISNVRERRAVRLKDIVPDEAEAVVQSEAQRSDSAEAEAEVRPTKKKRAKKVKAKKEAPMTFGSVDG